VALRILGSGDGAGVAREMAEAIEATIQGASAQVAPAGAGHFEVRVVAAAFAGKTSLQRQQMVYAAIAALMQGETAPVHAIDRMETRTP
jgi:BolA protein